TKVRQFQRLWIAFDKGASRDHFADVKPGSEPATDRAKRVIRHAGHGSEHYRWPDAERAEIERAEFAGSSSGDVTVESAFVLAIQRVQPCFLRADKRARTACLAKTGVLNNDFASCDASISGVLASA